MSKLCQAACKPGSVHTGFPARDDHSSGTRVTAAPHATNPDGEAKNPRAVLAPTLPPLCGLAPGGVYPATPVARGAVRSYRTVSP